MTAEKKYGTWTLPQENVQLERHNMHHQSLVQSDPICHSAGCTSNMWFDKLRALEKDNIPGYDLNPKLEEDVYRTFEDLAWSQREKKH